VTERARAPWGHVRAERRRGAGATTPPAAWRAALAAHPPRPLDPAEMGHVVVVATRPADAVRAVGTMMRAVHDAGSRLELVIVTADAAGDATTGGPPGDRTSGPADIPVRHLGLADPDPDVLAHALAPLLHDADAYLAPWAGDPDPVHAAAGRAAALAAPVTACGWGYPVGMWSRMRPDDPSIPWTRAFAHGPGPEVVFRIPRVDGAPLSRFDELYAGPDGAGDGDPWETRTSWYERRKRAVVLAALPAERYRHAAEPACGTGALTRELASRCDRVAASDFSPAAVAQTAAATAGLAVEVARLALPDPAALPAGIDLAVLGEVLYYLADADLARTVDRLADALEPGGDVVLVHWDGWPAEAPRDGAAAHRVLLDDPRFEALVEHVDEEFLLHVLRRW
jgi:SAM-dependent methyltransferase